jgi:hypothetical protein
MKMTLLISALLTLLVSTASAVSPGSLLTYEGILTDSGGTPITAGQTVAFQVLYGSCVVYAETQAITPGTAGEFSVIVGTGTRTDTTNNTADRIFASAGTVNCNGSSAVSVSGFTTRALRITVAGVDLSPDVQIGNIPFSINSQKLADKGASDFLQVNTGMATTQANLESILSRYTALNNLLNAYSGNSLTAQSATNFTGSLSGDVSGTQTTTSVDKIKGVSVDTTGLTSGKILKYDGTKWATADDSTGTAPSDASYTVKGIVQLMTDASTSGIQVSSGTIKVNYGTAANQIVKLDGSAKLPAVDGSALTGIFPSGASAGQVLSSTGSTLQWITPSATDNTKLPLAGGTMTGSITMGGFNITNVGFITMNAGSQLHLSNNSADPSLSTADKGKIWFNSTSNQIKYWDGSTVQALGVAGSGLTSLNGQSGSAQTFGTPGTSGTSPTWSSGSNVHTLNIPMASASGVTAGLLSKTDYDSLMAKQASGNYVTALSGDVTATGPGSATATISTGAVTSSKIADGTIIATDMDFTGVNAGTANLVIKDSTGKFTNFGCSTAGHVATWSASGWSCSAPSPLLPSLASGNIWVGNGSSTATAVALSGDATITNAGVLSLASVATSGTYSKVTIDSKGRVTTGASLAAADITTALAYTPVNKAGDVMTGSLGLGNYSSSAETSLTSGWSTSDKGKTWFNSSTNQMKYWDGSSIQALGVAGSGITALTGDVTASGTGSVAATIANGVVTSAKIADGTINGADMDFTGTVTATSGMTMKDSTGKFNSFACSTTGHVPTWTVTGWSCSAPPVLGGSTVSGTAPISVSNGSTNPVISVATATTSSSGVVQIGSGLAVSSGVVSADPANFPSLVPISKGGTGASTASAAFTALSPMTAKGDLISHSGSAPSILTAGTTGQILTADSAQTTGLKWITPTYFANGGNTFGADATLGLTDSYGLSFKTNSTTRMHISATGYLGIGATATAGFPLSVSSALATGTALQLVNTNSARSYSLNTGSLSSTYGASSFAINDETAGKTRFLIDPNGAAVLGGGTPITSATGTLTMTGGGTTVADAATLELTNPVSAVTNGTLGGKINFNVINNSGNKQVASIQGIAEGSGGTNGYGGRVIIWTKQDNATSLNATLVLAGSGNVGLGTAAPGYKLDVSGDANISTGSVYRIAGTSICTASGCTSSSDRRLKENIQPLQNSLDNILKLDAVSYDYIDKQRFGSKHQVGVIAQDVEKVFPEVVVTDEKTGMKAVAYDHLVAPLIEAVKSLYYKVTSSEEKIAEHERRIASVEEQKTLDRAEMERLRLENEALKKQNENLQKDLILIKSKLGL